jgi:transcription antitermination factor NusG
MKRWHVIRSKYRSEVFLYQQLSRLEIETYLPSIATGSLAPGTKKAKPYFPGYLFVYVDLEQVGLSSLQWLAGGLGLVCFGGEPAWVPESVIQMIRERVDQSNEKESHGRHALKAGDEIEVQLGPLSGYRGIFSSYLSDEARVSVFLQFVHDLQIRVDLPITQIGLAKQLQA